MTMPEFEIILSPEVQTKFPDFRACFLLISGVADYDSEEEKESFSNEIVSQVTKKYPTLESLKADLLKDAYNSFYLSMGINPKKVSTPIHQAGRVISKGTYRSIHRVIDICMLIEYTSLISFQVYDAEKLSRIILYELSTGTETLIDFHNKVQYCKLGELILRDEKGVIHSGFHGNDLGRLIDKNSTTCLVRIMGIPGLRQDFFDESINRFVQFYPQSISGIVSKNTPILTV